MSEIIQKYFEFCHAIAFGFSSEFGPVFERAIHFSISVLVFLAIILIFSKVGFLGNPWHAVIIIPFQFLMLYNIVRLAGTYIRILLFS